jgi:hypothetical protein
MALKYTTQYLVDFLKKHADDDLQNKWTEEEKDFKKGFKRTEKRSENKKVKGAPKKNKTAYNIFCSEERLKVKEDHPNLSNKDIFTEMGARWKKLKESDSERFGYFEKLANEDKNRYQTEKDNFVQPPDSEGDEKSSGKKRTKSSKPSGPKKAKTAYMFFCEHERKVVVKEKPELGAKDVLVELGARWQKLKESDPKKIKTYEAMAEKDKKRYESDKAAAVSSSPVVDSTTNDEDDLVDEEVATPVVKPAKKVVEKKKVEPEKKKGGGGKKK